MHVYNIRNNNKNFKIIILFVILYELLKKILNVYVLKVSNVCYIEITKIKRKYIVDC